MIEARYAWPGSKVERGFQRSAQIAQRILVDVCQRKKACISRKSRRGRLRRPGGTVVTIGCHWRVPTHLNRRGSVCDIDQVKTKTPGCRLFQKFPLESAPCTLGPRNEVSLPKSTRTVCALSGD